MPKNDRHYEGLIKKLLSQNQDITKRTVQGQNHRVNLLFIKQLVDRNQLSQLVIRPLTHYLSKNDIDLSAEICANHVICCDDCRMEANRARIAEFVLSGMVVILFDHKKEFLVINLKMVEKKAVSGPELTFTLRGPRDCFSENLDVNLSLIRYRIKDEHLRILFHQVGRRTKTRVAVLYIEDIANDDFVEKINTRINHIDTDGIIESGELQRYLQNAKQKLFPQIGLIERSDMACGALLEGKVVVICEGSGLALVAPKTFGEFLWSCEDNYDHQFWATCVKVLRIIALFFSISLSSLFIVVTSFNHDLVPPEYIVQIAISRSSVPFNAFTGTMILEMIVEILREALLRVPRQIGPAIGIVGAIIIGQAAIAAGVFSPLLLILVSLSFMASFVAPDYSIMNPFRMIKFFVIIMTGLIGLPGFVIALCLIITNLVSNNSFGVPFTTPLVPYHGKDLWRSFIYNKQKARTRPTFLKTKDKVRSK